MQRIYVAVFLTVSSLILTSCDTMFPDLQMSGMFRNASPDSDTRFSNSMEYNKAHNCMSQTINLTYDEYKVYVGTDSHIDTSTHNLDRFLNDYVSAEKAPMALHLGDLINAQNNYPRFDSACVAALGNHPDKPLFKTAGNHDLYWKQWDEFRKYYGTSTYLIFVSTPSGTDFYICLDSSSGTLGTKQMKWLKQVLEEHKDKNYRHRIVFTHTHIFKQDNSQGHTSNYPLEETYELLGLMSQYNIELVLMGHDHSREITRYGNVKYIIVDSMQDPQENPYYMILTLNAQSLHEDFISLGHKVNGFK